jgi:6-pyruvoyltetrahydropterin/6-carboxytetrahydropterin synthase
MRHTARVERQRLTFAAAHMATFAVPLAAPAADQRVREYTITIEPLHGHNYAVIIEAEGHLAADGWVIDFSVLKRIGRELCDSLDHHFLLQASSEALTVARDEQTVTITFGAKRYDFPREDVFELPVRNTTAELIAQWFWAQVAEALGREGVQTIERLTIGVEEAPGQIGWFGAALG